VIAALRLLSEKKEGGKTPQTKKPTPTKNQKKNPNHPPNTNPHRKKRIGGVTEASLEIYTLLLYSNSGFAHLELKGETFP